MFKNRMKTKLGLTIFPLIVCLFFANLITAQTKIIDVETFDKIIISPHIEVIFQEGEKESVSIESIEVPMEKLNVEVKNETLNVYLDGAKIISPNKKDYINGYKRTSSIYKETVVKAIVTYKKLSSIDLRGEQKFVFENNINADKLRLKIYGEAEVTMNEVDIQNLQASIYGENNLKIKSGTIDNQKFTSYGESEVNTLNVENVTTKVTSYGDATFLFNVSTDLNVTAYGDTTIEYTGNPNLNRGIVIGDTEITSYNK